MPAATTYWDYLRLDQLLSLQGGIEGDERALLSDELHFIVVHQAFELWFKLSLAELRLARDHLAEPRVPEETIPYVVHHLRRVTEILKLCVEQFRVMETLTPQDFLAFRDKLVPASGFQSFQMREIETLLGQDLSPRPGHGGADPLGHIRKLAAESPGGAFALARLEHAAGEQSLRSALHDWLARTPVQGSTPSHPDDDATVRRFLETYFDRLRALNVDKATQLASAVGASLDSVQKQFAESEARAREFLFAEDQPEPARARARRVRAGVLFIESYRELPLLAWPRLLVDTIVELEEQLVLWRTRHARMVERIIGRRIGTGGSSGVDYLDQTARQRIFVELWAVRTLLLPREALPELEARASYGFAGE